MLLYLDALFVIEIILLTSSYSEKVTNGLLKDKPFSPVEIRPVLVNCDLEREELFRHNFLHDCKKKLAMAIKLTSEPDQNALEQYIPIEHVFGVNKKRFRLVNPYVLRIRRQAAFETYRIRKINTVRGLIINDMNLNEGKSNYINNERKYRDTHNREYKEESSLGSTECIHISNNNTNNAAKSEYIKLNKIFKSHINDGNKNMFYENITYVPNVRRRRHDIKVYDDDVLMNQEFPITGDRIRSTAGKINENEQFDSIDDETNTRKIKGFDYMSSVAPNMLLDSNSTSNSDVPNRISKETEFDLYEIDNNPKILFSTRMQLFEKLSAPDGKTLWNDITEDDTASVSSENPEWTNENVNIHYKPSDFIPMKDFSLPHRSLYLLLPKNGRIAFRDGKNIDSTTDFIIVSRENVILIGANDGLKKNKNGENYTQNTVHSLDLTIYPRVGIRDTNALTTSNLKGLRIVDRGSKQYLQLPLRRPHQARIDLEAVADDNDIVLVGASGSLITIVSDTRHTRCSLDVQAKNTGLAAAKFRAVIRDCTPDFLSSSNINMDGLVTDLSTIPPHHTRTVTLQMPWPGQVNAAHCTVGLENHNGECIAVREVKLKREDRCFCVWHCDCVCLGEDPKLLCEGMTPAQVAAAGLVAPATPRHTRSICYPDLVYLNVCVTVFGVFLFLLFLGLIKACLGLFVRSVGSWGLREVLQAPRGLNHYYERSLRSRTVVYDDEGWPVHPDTKQQTVRLISKPMEYILNVIFFVILPGIVIWSVLRFATSRCRAAELISCHPKQYNTTKYYSSDIQSGHHRFGRRRRYLQKWMTPEAEALSNKIWSDERVSRGFGYPRHQRGAMPPPCMQPLLLKGPMLKQDELQSSSLDSEQEDTEYVLMEMQKSCASLNKNATKREKEETVDISPEAQKY